MKPFLLITALVAASPAQAQFQLLSVDGITETPLPAVRDLGVVPRGDPASLRMRLRNVSPAPATLRTLEVAGSGFSLAAPVALPQTVPATATVDFAVVFRDSGEGKYSAELRSDGISVLLTATVVAHLTLALEKATGPIPLAAGAAIEFGSVEVGRSTSVRLLVRNLTGRDQITPPFAISGDYFRVAAGSSSGAALRPEEESVLELRFTPSMAGSRRGVLAFGGRSFQLIGTGVAVPAPHPRVRLSIPEVASGRQGRASVELAEASKVSARGVLEIAFQPNLPEAVDTAIVFSTGKRTVDFAVAPGDERVYFAGQPSIGFQTGSTAGRLTISVRLGEWTDEQTVELAPAAVAISAVEAARTASGIEIRISGFDNTRTAGALVFTFFDRAGVPIPPGAIRIEGSAEFGRFFRSSDSGGLFLLRAAFPVSGDAAGVDSVEVELGNAAGVTRSPRVRF